MFAHLQMRYAESRECRTAVSIWSLIQEFNRGSRAAASAATSNATGLIGPRWYPSSRSA